MLEALEKIGLFLSQYAFVRYALIVGVLVALCAALLGVILVLKRFSMIGDGLSHAAFGATAIASVIGLTNNTFLVLPLTIAAAILLLKTSQSKKIRGDALIAMVSVAALAIGYLLLNVFKVSANVSLDVCTTLFGATAMLTLSPTDVWISIGLSALVIGFFVFFYNKIFAVTFDESFARASGTKTNIYNLVIATIIAIVIVVAMKLVGSLLVSALIVFPALSAMRVFRSFKGVTIASAVIAVVCAMLGFFGSIVFDTPVGPTIILLDIVTFLVFLVAGLLLRRKNA